MATKTTIVLEDDYDGGKADETVRFGLDGAMYEIDLSDKNADKLRKALSPFLEAARRTGGRSTTKRGSAYPPALSIRKRSARGRHRTACQSAAEGVFPHRSSSNIAPPVISATPFWRRLEKTNLGPVG